MSLDNDLPRFGIFIYIVLLGFVRIELIDKCVFVGKVQSSFLDLFDSDIVLDEFVTV